MGWKIREDRLCAVLSKVELAGDIGIPYNTLSIWCCRVFEVSARSSYYLVEDLEARGWTYRDYGLVKITPTGRAVLKRGEVISRPKAGEF